MTGKNQSTGKAGKASAKKAGKSPQNKPVISKSEYERAMAVMEEFAPPPRSLDEILKLNLRRR